MLRKPTRALAPLVGLDEYEASVSGPAWYLLSARGGTVAEAPVREDERHGPRRRPDRTSGERAAGRWLQSCFDCARREAEACDGGLAPLQTPALERELKSALLGAALPLLGELTPQLQPVARREQASAVAA